VTTAAIERPEVLDDYGPFERIDLPKTTVFYRDPDHSYWTGCKQKTVKGKLTWSGSGRLTGVTTVIQPWDFRPDSLMRWVERLTLEGVVRGFEGQTIPRDPHVLRQLLENKELRWEQIRDEAGKSGTNVHEKVFHALAHGEEIPSLADVAEAERKKAQGVLKWWSLREPEVLQAEQVVCSPEHGFAGRLDLRARIKDPLRPGIGIVDLKTGGFISNKAIVQPAGYDLGCLHSGLADEPADWYLILQVDDDGNFREIWSPATHADFLDSLRIYRRAAELSKVAKA
jgi:hypothetical protein